MCSVRKLFTICPIAGLPSWLLLASLASGQNVLIIIADDVGYAELESVKKDGWAPKIVSLAQNGIEFVNGFANPTCSPSRRSLQFGRWHFDDSGGYPCEAASGAAPLVADVSLADLAAGEGLTPAFFGKWHVGANPIGSDPDDWEEAPLVHGYELWKGTPANVKNCDGTSYSNWRFVDSEAPPSQLSTQYNPGVVEDELVAWWTNTPGPKFAVWASALAHGPYHAPPASFLPAGYPPPQDLEERYYAMIAALDLQVGRVLTHVDLATTLVFFVGDNGKIGKSTTFEGGIHVPFIVAGAGLVPGTSERLAHVADILPTVAHYLGATPPTGIDGLSLFGSTVRQHVICGASDQPTQDYCARTSRYKLRHLVTPPEMFTEELYDLELDPGENSPMDPDSLPVIAAFLRGKLYPELP